MKRKQFGLTIWLLVFAGGALFVALGKNSVGASRKPEVTFARDVAPILFRNCAACHRPDDNAPFSVLTYKDVRPWARSIKEKVISREMPPWHADRRYGEFENEARLTTSDIDIIKTWVDTGAKEGKPEEMPPLPAAADGWTIGNPDQVFAMLEDYTVAADAPDAYIHYTIPTRFREDRWIQAAEIRPGNRKIVHHVIAHILTPQSFRRAQAGGGQSDEEAARAAEIFYKAGTLARVRLDAPVMDDGASAANGGTVFKRRAEDEGTDLFSILLASYAPGKAPDVFPARMAKRIPAGSSLVLQIHYSSFRGALTKPEKDRTSVGLVFAKEPPAERVQTITVQNHFFRIPPGAANHRVTAAYTFERAARIISYMPHMHLRGKDMRYEAIYPDGRRETLLFVPRFNFNWQTIYRLKTPLEVPKGTRLIVTAHFDNSAKNKYNPDPTQAVRWGDPTYDEMLVGWLDVIAPDVNKAGNKAGNKAVNR